MHWLSHFILQWLYSRARRLPACCPRVELLRHKTKAGKDPPIHPTSKVHIHHNSVHTVLSPHHTCPENMPAPLVMYRRKSEILERGERNIVASQMNFSRLIQGTKLKCHVFLCINMLQKHNQNHCYFVFCSNYLHLFWVFR